MSFSTVVGISAKDGDVMIVLEDGTVYLGNGQSPWREGVPVPGSKRHAVKNREAYELLKTQRSAEEKASGFDVFVA